MDTLDFLNDIAGGTDAADAPEYKKHPIGEFHGVVDNVGQKAMPQQQNVIFEFSVKTYDNDHNPVGTAEYSEWGFSDEQIEEAKTTQEGRDKAVDKVRRIKRLFTDMKVFTPAEAKALVWSSKDASKPSVLNSFRLLVGKRCSVSVKQSFKDPSKTKIFLNGPSDTVTGAFQVSASRGSSFTPTTPFPQNTPPQQLTKPAQQQPLDRIPF